MALLAPEAYPGADSRRKVGGIDMYSESDAQCRECICATCIFRETDDCLEDADMCARCKNDEHCADCVYYEEE